ncbi:MAG: ATP-binding protein [Deltaproteobacteria bacterium]|jgi:AAA15 family ATPase/GTPase|nr:ATP-binding protein [Deltaproteobacteria bacterium]
MLLKLTVENFFSFKDKTTYAMVANSGRKFGSRVPQHPAVNKMILPAAAVFGGDGSGYENFARTLRFFKQLVTESPSFVNSLNLYTFQNYSDSRELPVKIWADFAAGDSAWRYGFMALKDVIINERLLKMNGSKKTLLFERRKKKLKLHRSMENPDDLKALFRSMKKSLLFLPQAARDGYEKFQDVYRWFSDTLHVTGQESYVHQPQISDEGSTDSRTFHDFIELVDKNSYSTRLDARTVPPDSPVHRELEGEGVMRSGDFMIRPPADGRGFEVYYRHKTFHDAKLLKLFPYERSGGWDYSPIPRPFGTEREKHSLVALMSSRDIMASPEPKIYFINFFDSAFDPIPARTIISDYLDSCSRDSRTQLIITSANALLLDKKVFRPDELWIAEPGDFGNTRLLSLGEYKKTIKKKAVWRDFKTGRIGGIYTPLLMAALEAGKERK